MREPLPSSAAVASIEEPPSIDLLGIRVHAITEDECVARIVRDAHAGRGGWIVTPNLDHMRRLRLDQRFRQTCANASLMVPDGIPLLWASRLQRTPLPGRVAGSNLISSVSKRAAEEGLSVFLLGGDPGTAERAADILETRYRGLRVAGTHCPPYGFEKDERLDSETRRRVSETDPDIVFVGLGSPKQEDTIQRFRGDLPRAWWIGVGISFSFLSGHVKRAPAWMQRSGLEWSHRLIQEPKRLASRYLLRGIPFACRLLATSAWRGMLTIGRRVS